MCPGTDEYVLGAPLFKKATLTFEDGKQMVINAPENNAHNVYVKSLHLNGQPYIKNYVKHKDLLSGGTLDFRMSDHPNLNRGTKPSDFPYSFSVSEKKWE